MIVKRPDNWDAFYLGNYLNNLCYGKYNINDVIPEILSLQQIFDR